MKVHGIIHLELEKFVRISFGPDTRDKVVERAGLGKTVYMPVQIYPDDDIVKVVQACAEVTGAKAESLVEGFGTHLVPMYLSVYGPLLDPSWRTLDVIQHTEETIHRVVRMRQPGAAPPRLHVERCGPKQVEIVYDSPRKLCALARGICRGIASHFGELVTIADRACMHRGDPKCVMVLTQT